MDVYESLFFMETARQEFASLIFIFIIRCYTKFCIYIGYFIRNGYRKYLYTIVYNTYYSSSIVFY